MTNHIQSPRNEFNTLNPIDLRSIFYNSPCLLEAPWKSPLKPRGGGGIIMLVPKPYRKSFQFSCFFAILTVIQGFMENRGLWGILKVQKEYRKI